MSATTTVGVGAGAAGAGAASVEAAAKTTVAVAAEEAVATAAGSSGSSGSSGASVISQEASAPEPKKKRKLSFPAAFTILFILTIVAVAATWVVPAGSYSKLAYDADTSTLVITNPEGEAVTMPATQESLDNIGVMIDIGQFTSGALKKPVSIPGTYQQLEQQPKGFQELTLSMVEGTMEAVDIMVFIFVLGGLIGVVNVSGAFNSGLIALTKKTKGREFLCVFLVSVFMVIGGTTCGLEEEAVAFYPILVPVFLALGYDAIVSVGAIFLAGSMGTTFSTVNPFATVIASNAAGTVFTEGIEWRIVGCIVGGIVVVAYLYWYCRKIKANPEFSYAYEDREQFQKLYATNTQDGVKDVFTWKKKLILILFVAAFVIMVYGVMSLGWWFPQMAASFLLIAIIVMFLSGKGEKEVLNGFTQGASSLVGVSLIIGLARGINLIMEQGMISDTLLFYSSNLVSGMLGPVFIIMLMLIFFVLGFVVPSSSGLAVLAMPILAPLADTVGIPRFIVVSAYNWGQYGMLYLAPTGLVMATLQMLNMRYSHWLRFVWPMVVFVLVFGAIMLTIQVLVYG